MKDYLLANEAMNDSGKNPTMFDFKNVEIKDKYFGNKIESLKRKIRTEQAKHKLLAHKVAVCEEKLDMLQKQVLLAYKRGEG